MDSEKVGQKRKNPSVHKNDVKSSVNITLDDFKKNTSTGGGTARIRVNDNQDLVINTRDYDYLRMPFACEVSQFQKQGASKLNLVLTDLSPDLEAYLTGIISQVKIHVANQSVEIFGKQVTENFVESKFWPMLKPPKDVQKYNSLLQLKVHYDPNDTTGKNVKVYECDPVTNVVTTSTFSKVVKNSRCKVNFKIGGIWQRQIGWGIFCDCTDIMIEKRNNAQECVFVSSDNNLTFTDVGESVEEIAQGSVETSHDNDFLECRFND